MTKSSVSAALVPRRPASLSAEVMAQISELVSKPKRPSSRAISQGVQKAVLRLNGRVTPVQLRTLRDMANALASEVDQLLSLMEHPGYAEAAAQDRTVRAVLDAANRAQTPAPMTTPKSIREGDKFREHAAEVAMASAKKRIAAGELITSGELQRRLHVSRKTIKTAVDSRRLFAILGPSGENYYPAFYAETAIDRRTLEKVSKLLGALPGSVKYGFFTSMSEQLGDTPLRALRSGRVEHVLKAASGFLTR